LKRIRANGDKQPGQPESKNDSQDFAHGTFLTNARAPRKQIQRAEISHNDHTKAGGANVLASQTQNRGPGVSTVSIFNLRRSPRHPCRGSCSMLNHPTFHLPPLNYPPRRHDAAGRPGRIPASAHKEMKVGAVSSNPRLTSQARCG
jgi:hypothetical protein